MTWRRQLPAYSPLPLRAVLAGAGGLVADSGASRSALEAILPAHFAAGSVLLTDSGTGALALAIRTCLAAAPGSPVALPAYACYDVATAADGAGASVVLYDVDPTTLAPEPGSLRRAVERGPRAVVLVHLFGIPVDPEPVRAAIGASGAWLIEDAAQGAGAALRGRPLGSFGDVVVLSFGRGKGNTAGRGGALLARGDAAIQLLAGARERVLASRRGAKEAAQLAAQWLLGRPSLYAIPASIPFLQLGETIYHLPAPVRGLSDVAAGTLPVTWPLGAGEGATRRQRARRLLARAGKALTPIRAPQAGEAGYLRLPFVVSEEARAAAESSAARALGVMPGYPTALCDLAGFSERVLNRSDGFPGARLLAQRLITVPVHGLLTERDLEALERWLASW